MWWQLTLTLVPRHRVGRCAAGIFVEIEPNPEEGLRPRPCKVRIEFFAHRARLIDGEFVVQTGNGDQPGSAARAAGGQRIGWNDAQLGPGVLIDEPAPCDLDGG